VNSMKASILLNPDANHSKQLRDAYARAFGEATELYIASAYLTAWEPNPPLSRECKSIVFIAGTDFGLSRKAAMRNVLAWLPKHGACLFLAAPRLMSGGFHPKIMAWQTKAHDYFAIVGSSNLSKAAFEHNYEANVLLQITKEQFKAIVSWLEPLINDSVPVTEEWIEKHYTEAEITNSDKKSASPETAVNLDLPNGATIAEAVSRRRLQQAAFKEISTDIEQAARLCAAGKMSDSSFWAEFWRLWAHHLSRFQGSGVQFSGRGAKWSDTCTSLVTILDAGKGKARNSQLDAIVSREIDHLKSLKNPMRGAWLTEMLCHYFPSLYPVVNAPVHKWLKQNHWSARRGSSEGQKYIELARKLRYALKSHPAGAKDLAELDHAIWAAVH
jgi:hypothetical protein